MDQKFSTSPIDETKECEFVSDNHSACEKTLGVPSSWSQVHISSEPLQICEFDSKEFDDFDIDLLGFYRQLKQPFSSITRLRAIEPRDDSSTIFRLVFESGNLYKSKLSLNSLWKIVLSVVEGLADLESVGLFYSAVKKTNIVYSVRDQRFQLINPFSCPDFLELVLAVNYNCRVDSRIKAKLCSEQIKRNIRELALCFVSLLFDHAPGSLIQMSGSINWAIKFLKSHNHQHMADFLIFCLGIDGDKPAARLKQLLQATKGTREICTIETRYEDPNDEFCKAGVFSGVLSFVRYEAALELTDSQFSKLQLPTTHFEKSLTSSPKSIYDQETAPHSSNKLLRDIEDNRSVSPGIDHSEILANSSNEIDHDNSEESNYDLAKVQDNFHEKIAKSHHENLEKSSLLFLEEIENLTAQSSIDVSDAVSCESVDLNLPEITSSTFFGFAQMKNTISVKMNIVAELTKNSIFCDIGSSSTVNSDENRLPKNSTSRLQEPVDRTNRTISKDVTDSKILCTNLHAKDEFLHCESSSLLKSSSWLIENEYDSLLATKRGMIDGWDLIDNLGVEEKVLRPYSKSQPGFKFRHLPRLECVVEVIEESEESQDEQ